jgi:hypothetical protein
MFKLNFSFWIVVSLTVFQSCYISKSLERDVNVSLDKSFNVEISNSGNSTFSSNYSAEEYKAAFIEGMKAEFATGHIIVVDNSPEFSISVSEVSMAESTKPHTVSDADSDDNGKVFELTSIQLKAKGKVVQTEGSRSRGWSADKSKDEKVTNSLSGGQIITGKNKDKKMYREKELDNDEVLDLARKCGRRSGTRIINDIVKALK